MRTLNIAPEAQWLAFDDELSLRVRRITMHESLEIVRGTALEAAFSGAHGGELTLGTDDMLRLSERIVEAMVVGWTVQDPEGADVPVSQEAARWLATETPGLTGWLVNTVFLGITRNEAEVEAEKGG